MNCCEHVSEMAQENTCIMTPNLCPEVFLAASISAVLPSAKSLGYTMFLPLPSWLFNFIYFFSQREKNQFLSHHRTLQQGILDT